MKNLLYLCLIFLVLGCGSDDESSVGGTINALPEESTLLTLNVGDRFHPMFVMTGHAYLTDEDGKLLKDTNLLNNNSYELKAFYDYANKPYDLTIAYEYNPIDILGRFYYFTTFLDLAPTTLDMPGVDFSTEDAEVSININNIGTTDYNLFTFGSDETSANVVSLSCSEIDAGSCDYRIGLKRVPDNVYFSFKKPTEDNRRYLLLKDLYGEETYSFDYENIPEITDIKTINFPPECDFVSSKVSGFLLNAPNQFHTLSNEHSSNGETHMIHFYPKNIFDGYKVIQGCRIADTGYTSRRIEQEVKSTFNLPDLDFQINNNRIESFEADASLNSDYYLACFHFKPSPSIGVSIKWFVYGKSEEDIKFSMSNISELLFERLNHSDLTLDDFELTGFSIYNLNGALSFEEITKSIVETGSDDDRGTDLLEYVSRNYY
ncbi:MAG: hypothetical protein AB8F74_15245 [Saprospiraceae bacterium]